MVDSIIFMCVISFVALQRFFEMKKSERNRTALLAGGGREHGAGHFKYMVALHVLWIITLIIEFFIAHRTIHTLWSLAFFILFLIGQSLRILAMRELNERWCARVITVKGLAPVHTGIFRHFNHPNYLGVIIEIAALPLMFSAYFTAIIFSVLNLLLLRHRIAIEEKALHADNNYFRYFSKHRRI